MFVMISVIDKWFASTCLVESAALLVATDRLKINDSLQVLCGIYILIKNKVCVGSSTILESAFGSDWLVAAMQKYISTMHGPCLTTIASLPPKILFGLWMFQKLYFKLVAGLSARLTDVSFINVLPSPKHVIYKHSILCVTDGIVGIHPFNHHTANHDNDEASASNYITVDHLGRSESQWFGAALPSVDIQRLLIFTQGQAL